MAMQLRPLSIGELLDRTFGLYRNNFLLFVGIGTLPQVLMVGMVLAMAAIGGVAAVAAPGKVMAGLAGIMIAIPLLVLAYVAAWALSQAAIVYALSQVYSDRKTTIVDCYRLVGRRVWSLTGLVVSITFILIACFIVGLLAIIVGSVVGLFLGAAFLSLAVPVMVLEGRGIADSLSRSYRLVKTDLGKVCLVLLVFLVVQYAAAYLGMIPAMALLIIAGQHGTAPVWISLASNLVQLTATAVVAPLMPVGLGLCYYDIRVRQEALDLQIMMAALGPVQASAATATPGQAGPGIGTNAASIPPLIPPSSPNR